MQKAISYMEERMQVYQNTLMDHDLVVSDETASNWRKGCPDPRYSVMVSKRIQTEMTSQDLSKNENEFASTKRMLKVCLPLRTRITVCWCSREYIYKIRVETSATVGDLKKKKKSFKNSRKARNSI